MLARAATVPRCKAAQPPANHRHHQGDQRQHRVLQFEIQAGLVATLRRRREKLHYLNPVPIHQIADRWIGKYERGRLRLLADLKRHLEGKTND